MALINLTENRDLLEVLFTAEGKDEAVAALVPNILDPVLYVPRIISVSVSQ